MDNMMKGSYQHAPVTDHELNEQQVQPQPKSKGWIALGIASVLLIVSVVILRNTFTPNSEVLSETAGLDFCKVSCSDPCATHSSVYGTLCCDWTPLTNGGKTCPLTITADNYCHCGAGESTRNSNSPEREGATKSNGDDDIWGPFAPLIPFPTFPPMKPIEVPKGAVSCSKHCKHPVGLSQFNGKSYCCEEVKGKSCTTTQVDGECFCSYT